jgi:hypothetical protein
MSFRDFLRISSGLTAEGSGVEDKRKYSFSNLVHVPFIPESNVASCLESRGYYKEVRSSG